MIGIIIINFGNPGRTIRFVREECSKVKGEHRTVVVDNGSGPEALAELQAALGQDSRRVSRGRWPTAIRRSRLDLFHALSAALT